MIEHSIVNIAVGTGEGPSALDALATYLGRMPHLRLHSAAHLRSAAAGATAALTCGSHLSAQDAACLSEFVAAGNGWLHVADGPHPDLPAVFGAGTEPLEPASELRVLFTAPGHPLSARLPEAVYVSGCRRALVPRGADTQAILYADWHHGHRPVLTLRREGRGKAACTTLADLTEPIVQQILGRLLHELGGHPPPAREMAVGILGYAPSVGRLHGLGVEQTAGLRLAGICDLDPGRLAQARRDFPGIAVYGLDKAMAADPALDLVVVATPPNTHATLCRPLLEAGKHVVCEKPLALSRRETDQLVECAGRMRRHLSCHQNRRFDPDYRAIREATAAGRIGDLFHLETFVGGFGHPCGYWHSHAAVSGGQSFDWGAHYLDWIVSLMPYRIEAVWGSRHKRVWHDVTNADQECIRIRFEGGREAEFLHSDIAAARKPKWYLLGTRGAITGEWKDATALTADPRIYFQETPIPATEMPPALILYRREREGRIETLHLALPPRDPFGFHRNLADHLLLGEPLAAPLADSVKVVAVLEAAARSMARNGAREVVDG